jgi:hypothetical protein
LRAFCSSALWQIRPCIFSLGCRNAVYNSLLGCRKCRPLNSSGCRNAGAPHGGMGYSSTLGLQTQQQLCLIIFPWPKHLFPKLKFGAWTLYKLFLTVLVYTVLYCSFTNSTEHMSSVQWPKCPAWRMKDAQNSTNIILG